MLIKVSYIALSNIIVNYRTPSLQQAKRHTVTVDTEITSATHAPSLPPLKGLAIINI